MLPLRRIHEYIIIKYVILNGSASFNDIKIELKNIWTMLMKKQ